VAINFTSGLADRKMRISTKKNISLDATLMASLVNIDGRKSAI